jgi:hypothetical protein
MEVTKDAIFQIKVFETIKGMPKKSKTLRLYGIMGQKPPNLEKVADIIRTKFINESGIVLKG